MIFFLVFSFALSVPFIELVENSVKKKDGGDTWVVLVAGANGWENYWSQAQICAAYQQVHQAGISDDKIIVWMYDDVASSSQNPYPGKIFLYKGGPDVYKGVLKDVVGSDITPANFMKLLKGEDMTIGTKKSLKSTADDRVFIYFSDHGGAGVIYFPGFVEMYKNDIISTLQYMHENSKYSQLVWYLDTCHSGSIFSSGELPDNWNIYTATSSDPNHVAWLCDCKWINPKSENDFPCTSNCWGKYWLQDTLDSMSKGTFGTRTLGEQFLFVQNETYHDKCYYYPNCDQQSCRYGDMSIQKDTLDLFQGPGHTNVEKDDTIVIPTPQKDEIAVPMTHAKLYYLEKLASKPHGDSEKLLERQEKVDTYKEYMKSVDNMWYLFASKMGVLDGKKSSEQLYPCDQKERVDWDCHKELVESAKSSCGSFDEYSSQYLRLLMDVCNVEVAEKNLELAKSTLRSICN